MHGRLHVELVDRHDLIHAFAVEHDRVLGDRLQPAFGRRATRLGHDVDPVLVAERQRGGDVVGARCLHDRRRDRQVVDPEDVFEFAIAIEAVLFQRLLIGVDLVGAEQASKPFDDRFTGDGGHGALLVRERSGCGSKFGRGDGGVWLASSADEIPAVDGKNMAIDIVRRPAGKEDTRPHQVLDLPPFAGRDVIEHRPVILGVGAVSAVSSVAK